MRVETSYIATGVPAEPTVWLSGEFTTLLNKLLFPVAWVAAIGGVLLSVVVRTGHARHRQ